VCGRLQIYNFEYPLVVRFALVGFGINFVIFLNAKYRDCYSDSEYSCYYSMFVPIRYTMSKKLGHLVLGVSSVCKSDNFDSGVFMLLLLLVCMPMFNVPCRWVCSSVSSFCYGYYCFRIWCNGFGSNCGVYISNDNGAFLDMPYDFYNNKLMNSYI
jgi:hypothetical protein